MLKSRTKLALKNNPTSTHDGFAPIARQSILDRLTDREFTVTLDPMTEQQAKTLFIQQLTALSRRGPALNSEARLKAIFARSEAACREQEQRLVSETDERPITNATAS